MTTVVEQALPVTVAVIRSPSPSSTGLFPVIINLVLRWPVIAFVHGLWTNYNPIQQVTTLIGSMVTMNRVVEPVLPVTVISSPSESSAGLFSFINNLVLRWPVIPYVHCLWAHYNLLQKVTTVILKLGEEEDLIKPGSGFKFNVFVLVTFTATKSEGEFSLASKIGVASVLLYGVFSVVRRDTAIARLGRNVFLCIFVGTLAYGLYF